MPLKVAARGAFSVLAESPFASDGQKNSKRAQEIFLHTANRLAYGREVRKSVDCSSNAWRYHLRYLEEVRSGFPTGVELHLVQGRGRRLQRAPPLRRSEERLD